MPDYMANLRVKPESRENVQELARQCLPHLRGAAEKSKGQVAGTWFTFDGEEIVAMFRSADVGIEDTLREKLEEVCVGFNVQVTPLRSVQDRLALGPDDDLSDLDPVNLASDLSFPASDPPSWPKRRG